MAPLQLKYDHDAAHAPIYTAITPGNTNIAATAGEVKTCRVKIISFCNMLLLVKAGCCLQRLLPTL